MRFCPLLFSMLLLITACGGPPLPTDPPNLAEAKEGLSRGNYWYDRGCYPEAARYFTEALGAARLSDDVLLIIRANNSLGTAALAAGDLPQAAAFLERASSLSAATGGEPEMDKILGNLGSLAFKAGETDDAENFWREAVRVAEARGESPIVHLCNLARLYLNQGRAEFQALAERALREAQSSPDLSAKADAFNLAGHAALARGNAEEAEAYFQEALALDRKTENSTGLAQDTEALGRLRLAQGKVQEAAGFFDRAFFLMAATGDGIGGARVYDALKKLSQSEGFPKNMEPYDKALRQPEEYGASGRCP